MVMMMKMSLGRAWLLLLPIFFINADSKHNFYFDIQDRGESASIIDLRAKAEASRLIRNNAYLSFDLKNKNYYSDCWMDFIKNRKIKIETSESFHKLYKKSKNTYRFILNIEPKKIIIKDVKKNEFLNYCKSIKLGS